MGGRHRIALAALAAAAALLAAGAAWYHRSQGLPARTAGAAPLTGARPEAAADWSTYHGDPALTGHADATVPESPVRLWSFRAGSPIVAAPVTGGDRIYFATARNGLFALDWNGTMLWCFAPRESSEEDSDAPVAFSAPASFVDGTVVAGSAAGDLYAVDASTGREIWHTRLAAMRGSATWTRSPGDGKVRLMVVGQPDGVVRCLDLASGATLWESAKTNRCDGSPASNGSEVVFGNCDAALHVLSAADGTRLGRIELGEDGQVAGGVALAGGFAFSGSRNGRLICADLGELRVAWARSLGAGEVFGTPAVAGDRVVEGCADGSIHCLDRRTGEAVWQAAVEGDPGSPVIAGERVVVASNGSLYLFRLADGAKLWSIDVSDEVTSPAVCGGTILVGADDGQVTAFGNQERLHAER